MSGDWRLEQLIEELQHIHKEHGNIDVVLRDPDTKYALTFDLDVTETLQRPKWLEIQSGYGDDHLASGEWE